MTETPWEKTRRMEAEERARLRESILAYLEARPGQWVPRSELWALTPRITVHVTEGDSEAPFGFDDARGSAWSEIRPDDGLVIEVMGMLRRELRTVERISPDRSMAEYWLYADGERVGLGEIAERLQVERDTADHWRIRRVLPEPDPADAEGRRPRWRWGTIRAWAVETRRAPQ